MAKFLTFFCTLALAAAGASDNAQEVAFSCGTARRHGEGVVVRQDSRTLDVCAYFVSRGWGFKPIKGSLTRVTVEDGALRMSFSAVSPPDAHWQNDLPMLIVVKGVSTEYPDGCLRLGSTVASFDKANVWGYGSTMESDSFGYRFSTTRQIVQSFWNKAKTGQWEVRFHTKGEKQPDGSVRYDETLTIAKAS